MYRAYDRSRRPVELHACMRVSRGKPGEEEVRRGGGGSGNFLENSNFYLHSN